MTFEIKAGDTSPSIEYTLQDSNNNAIDITGHNEVEFHMVELESRETVVNDDTNGNVVVSDAENGRVKYEWTAEDTAESGLYLAEWEVTYADNTVETFPNNDHIVVWIFDELA